MSERYTTYSMNVAGRPMHYVIDSQNNGTEMFRSRDKQAATGRADTLNRQAETPVEPTAPATTPTARAGWSKAAGRRAGAPVDTVGQMLGMAKSGPYTICHYCGLNPRTCDCN
ncbi:hypothetical protein AB0J14_04860 [Micromonospora arborensis]|uniref:hypothetical protein n=1 Tax=Micromonospora arborensis TaxID=2116518 RepID=UPI0033F0EFDB